MKSTLFIIWAIIFTGFSSQSQTQKMDLKLIRYNRSVSIPNKPAQQNNNATTSCTQDTIILTTQAAIDTFSLAYPTCTNPRYLLIDGTGASPAITSLSGLSSITQVVNKLKVSHTSITSLSDLTNLTQINISSRNERNYSFLSKE